MISVREEKAHLRKLLKERRAKVEPSKKEELDRAICKRISALACFRYADSVLLYAPIGSEIDLMPLAKEALVRGKRIAFPVCDTKSCEMTFKYVGALSELTCGSYNIPEPPSCAEEFRDSERALCIVPALSFDREGFRLGYGKGYYDRFLKSFSGTSLGAAYNDFLSDRLPRDRYDRAVSVIVTERGSIITDAKEQNSIKER